MASTQNNQTPGQGLRASSTSASVSQQQPQTNATAPPQTQAAPARTTTGSLFGSIRDPIAPLGATGLSGSKGNIFGLSDAPFGAFSLPKAPSISNLPPLEGKEVDELLTNAMVGVYVGPNQKFFYLHQELLCDRSQYFVKAFKGSFKESEDKTLYLLEDNVGAFELFVRWLYGATLSSPQTEAAFKTHIELYILAEKICLEHLKNTAIDLIKSSSVISTRWGSGLSLCSTLSRIYKNTPAGSPLRRYFLRATVLRFNRLGGPLVADFEDLLREEGDFAPEFVYALQDSHEARLVDPRHETFCAFHQHEDTRKCPE